MKKKWKKIRKFRKKSTKSEKSNEKSKKNPMKKPKKILVLLDFFGFFSDFSDFFKFKIRTPYLGVNNPSGSTQFVYLSLKYVVCQWCSDRAADPGHFTAAAQLQPENADGSDGSRD